jgi:hypothetical protein
MAVRIGDLLLQEKLITPGQLEEALKYQVIFGGKLGTNLIEMAAVGDFEIAWALSKKFGLPAASREELAHIPPPVIQALPREIVEKFGVIPLRLAQRRLTLVVPDPSDLKVIDEIAFRTGFIIQSVVAPEVSMALALEKYYGLCRDRRYVQVAKQSISRQGIQDEPPPYPPAAPKVDMWEIPEPAPSPKVVAEVVAERRDAAGGDRSEGARPRVEAIPALAKSPVEALKEILVGARDRDDILDALATFLGGGYPRSALFLVRGELALGWKGTRDGQPLAGFDQVQIPFDEPSVLKTVAENGSFYLGPLPRTPFNSMLLQELGGSVPKAALLVPLQMMGRVLAILYVDGQGRDLDLGEQLPDLQKLAARAAMAFEILVLKNKIVSL